MEAFSQIKDINAARLTAERTKWSYVKWMFKWRAGKERTRRDNGSMEKFLCRKQDVFCLDEARLKVKQKETFNICTAFL